jgi:hypothetical protein
MNEMCSTPSESESDFLRTWGFALLHPRLLSVSPSANLRTFPTAYFLNFPTNYGASTSTNFGNETV